MKYKIACVTERGNYRKTNQDRISVQVFKSWSSKVLMAIVCDGVGGLSFGDRTAAFAIENFEEWFLETFKKRKKLLSISEIVEEWKDLIIRVNQEIYWTGEKTGAKSGTTFSAFLILKQNFIVFHVGDCRIYRIAKKITQLTDDHTLANEEVKKGRLTKQEAIQDKRRNILIKCVGAEKNLQPQIILGNIKSGEGILLCSDGFWHSLSEEKIKRIFQKGKLQENLKNVANEFLINEKDNLSAIAIKIN